MHILKSKEKKERALGTKLGLKAHRCSSPKCAMIRRPTRPGVHGKKFSRSFSEFKQQLMEKQKIKFSYGLTERQIKSVFTGALHGQKSVIEFILKNLEMRLDNAVFRLGLTPSRIMGRHMVSHGHFLVNGRKVTVPSYKVKIGDIITIKESSKDILLFKDLKNTLKGGSKELWLSLDVDKMEGKVNSFPEGISLPFNINLVVDYYSR